MKKIYLLAIVFVLSINISGLAQHKTANIHFLENDTVNEKEIIVRYSIKGLPNYLYAPYMHRYTTNENRISITVPDSIPFFTMQIKSKSTYHWGALIYMLISQGEVLNIRLDSIHPAIFEGSYGKLHQFLFHLNKESRSERINTALNSFLSSNMNESFYDFMKKPIAKDIACLDNLHNSIEIDEETYLFVKNLIIDEYLYRAGRMLKTLQEYPDTMNKPAIDWAVNKLYEEYEIAFYSGMHLSTKARLKALGIIPGEKLDLGFSYKQIMNDYIYLNRQEQESLIAGDIITNVAAGWWDIDQLTLLREEFKKIFPFSIYNSILDDLEVTEHKDYVFAYYSVEDGFQEYGRFETELSQIIQKTGKPTLVDIWATWCSPCMAEFKHLAEITPFLRENNMAMLFVSIDFAGAYASWKDIIKREQLEGFHFFATDKDEEISALVFPNSGIPRTILFNEKGEVLLNKCERISSGKLIAQIKEALAL
jgi:thiol-disulfide isomerase/thioredoxin